jgi:hypothetical protein
MQSERQDETTKKQAKRLKEKRQTMMLIWVDILLEPTPTQSHRRREQRGEVPNGTGACWMIAVTSCAKAGKEGREKEERREKKNEGAHQI